MEQKKQTNNFTPEQVAILQKNRYVVSVTVNSIRFSDEFKRFFSQRVRDGKSPSAVFCDCGIDPDVLGPSRVKRFQYQVNKCIANEMDDAERQKKDMAEKKKADKKAMDAQIERLERELIRAKQEVEFLKKLQQADREAQRQWEAQNKSRKKQAAPKD